MKIKFNVDAGRRLQLARKNLGYTQAQMAEKLDICEESFRKLELGKAGLTAERLNKLNELFHINPDYIVTGQKNSEIFAEIESYLLCCTKEEQLTRANNIMKEVMEIIARTNV